MPSSQSRFLGQLQHLLELIDLSMILSILHPMTPDHLGLIPFNLIQELPTIQRYWSSGRGISMPKSLAHLDCTLRNDAEERPLKVFGRCRGQCEIGLHLEETVQFLALICIYWKWVRFLKSQILDVRRDQARCATSHNGDREILGKRGRCDASSKCLEVFLTYLELLT